MSRAVHAYPPERVSLREVGLRDGLQMSKGYPDTGGKIDWLTRAAAAGVRHFEVGSFLPRGQFPQFADLSDVLAQAPEGLHKAVLTMNARAIESAVQSPAQEMVCVVSATEAHSRANIRRSRAESIDLVREAARTRGGSDRMVNAGIAMAFGCSISGAVAPAEVLRLVDACLQAGADMVGIADTVGFAGPREVAALCGEVERLCYGIPFTVHLHDTRGLGLANAAAALDSGARVLDGAIGGLGGCPFAPGATGNVVFEDLAYLCARMGFETGIDIDALAEVRAVLARHMPDDPLVGAVARAGLPPLEGVA